MRMGRWWVSSSARSRRQTSMPETSGRLRSSTITLGLRARAGERLGAGLGLRGAPARLAQVEVEQRAQIALVVDDEDEPLRRRRAHGCTARRLRLGAPSR